MIKNIAWNMFKNTGNIDTFLEFKQIRDIENGNIANASMLPNEDSGFNLSAVQNNANEFNPNAEINNGDIPVIQKVELNGNNKNEWNNNF